jgi:hypothetical protein
MYFIITTVCIANLFALSYLLVDVIEYLLKFVLIPYMNIIYIIRNEDKKLKLKCKSTKNKKLIINSLVDTDENKLFYPIEYHNFSYDSDTDSDMPELIDLHPPSSKDYDEDTEEELDSEELNLEEDEIDTNSDVIIIEKVE